MKILSIETSCDETACAIIEDGRKIIANEVYSQIDIHQNFGGVVPEVASRNHVNKMPYMVEETLKSANLTFDDIDGIAVTYGPGLVGALLVGVHYAKGLAFALDKPLIPVNHIEGHVCANYLAHAELEPPFLCMIVSGGHTHLVKVNDYTEYEILGRTLDDAAGEAFDKVARTLGLGYPGGPRIDKLAKGQKGTIDFPRALVDQKGYDFSFSGLKSAVLNHINSCKMKNQDLDVTDIATSFQEAVVDILTKRAKKALDDFNLDKLVLAGGVAANSALRASLESMTKENGKEVFYPGIAFCTDNAAMIGSAAYYTYKAGHVATNRLNAVPNLKIGQYKYD